MWLLCNIGFLISLYSSWQTRMIGFSELHHGPILLCALVDLVPRHHGQMLVSVQSKGLHPCLRDLANTRIREPDSQEMAGSCLVREKIRVSGLVCSRLAFLI